MADSLASGSPVVGRPAPRPTSPTPGRTVARGTADPDAVRVAPGVRLRAAWARARARNALRRSWIIGGVGGSVLVGALAALILVPREAMRIARSAAPRPGEKVDTTTLAARAVEERAAVQRAEAGLAGKRELAVREAAARAARARAAAALAAARGGAGRRDSLLGLAAELERLIGRAQTSPLPNSYRALAGAQALRGDPRVRAAIDSLDDVEREREAFGLVGGVDPVYVSLTNRATQLGRVVEGIAERRRAALQGEAAAANAAPAAAPDGAPAAPPAGSPEAAGTPGAPGAPGVAAPPPAGTVAVGAPGAAAGAPPQAQDAPAAGAPANPGVAGRADSLPAAGRPAAPVPVPIVRVDSAAELARLDTARLRLDQVSAALAAARVRNQTVDQRVNAARARADVEAPPVAVAAAAAVLALAVGYATALLVEVRRPRLADRDEAERVARVRVLAVVRPDADVDPERARRRADARVPALVNAAVESYRLVYLGLSATGARVSRVAVTAAEPGVAAAVALNIAVAAAEDGRSTLVVDADVRHAVASGALGVRDRLGLADAVHAGLPVEELVTRVPVGRGAALHVLPAGGNAGAGRGRAPVRAEGAAGADEDPRAELARTARAYDMTVTSLPPVAAGAADRMAGPEAVARDVLAGDVIVCARAGHTPLAGLTREIARLNALGAHVHGLVIWDDDPPTLLV
jgi:Mrp family chromosome partitioning ATPase